MTAPAPTVCPTCKGDGLVNAYWDFWAGDPVRIGRPCPDCCCHRCGKTTPTPPLCADCNEDLGDDAYERSHQ